MRVDQFLTGDCGHGEGYGGQHVEDVNALGIADVNKRLLEETNI